MCGWIGCSPVSTSDHYVMYEEDIIVPEHGALTGEVAGEDPRRTLDVGERTDGETQIPRRAE